MSSNEFFYSTPINPHASKALAIGPVAHSFGVNTYVRSFKGEQISFHPNNIDLDTIFRSRKALARSIKFYGHRLAKIDPASFKFKTKNQRKALEEELLNTFYLIYDECQLHLFENNRPLLRERGAQLVRCVNLLERLRSTPEFGEHASPQLVLQDSLEGSADKPLKYLALINIAPQIAKTMLAFTSEEGLASVKDSMCAVNIHRLNWVWGGGFDCALLNLVPASVGHVQHASQVFSDIAPVTGYMSWVIHYTCLGIELYLLTKGALKGSWMDPWRTEEDKNMNVSIWERFQTQWEMRKFAILNYAFWGTANLACFFWLVGSGTLGFVGNGLTGVLLVFDLALTAWSYSEKKTEHMAVLEQHIKDIDDLKLLIASEPSKGKRLVLHEHQKVLEAAMDECVHEWDAAEKSFHYDLMYAAGLFTSFSILCCFFFPPAALVPAAVLILGVTGAALGFLMSIVYQASKTRVEIELWQVSKAITEDNIEGLKEKLKGLTAVVDTSPEIERLQLERGHLENDLHHQNAMIDYYQTETMLHVFSQAMIPALAFGLLVFANVGLPVVLPAVILMMMSVELFKRQKPDVSESAGFDLPLPHP